MKNRKLTDDGLYRGDKAHRARQKDLLLKCQDGKCAICGTDKPGTGRQNGWHLDHNHITNVIRGVLCPSCNYACAMMDDPIFRDKVFAYLNNPPAIAVYREIAAAEDPWLDSVDIPDKCAGCGLNLPRHLADSGIRLCVRCESLISVELPSREIIPAPSYQNGNAEQGRLL